jgi:hypothetical protein
LKITMFWKVGLVRNPRFINNFGIHYTAHVIYLFA